MEDTANRSDQDGPNRTRHDCPERSRKIIHIDMDAFYASVEQRDNPELRGRPVAVGGSRERGVVAAASYEARKFGVRSAMPSITARRKCPDLIFVNPRFDVYQAVSIQIRAIFSDYTPLIEPLSLDEAYLDVTGNLKGIDSATQIAEEIRARIHAETSLTASAGVSYNKFLAKLASDHRKPDGLFVITPRMGPAFIEALPVGRFHGVGPATTAKMNRLGIHTGLDLRTQTLAFLRSSLARQVHTTTGSHAASTTARSGPTASASRWAPRTPSLRTSPNSTTCARRSSRSLRKSGATAIPPALAAARWSSRSSTPISGRLRGAEQSPNRWQVRLSWSG
jgi:nucleotidyltransferase/DNA polymerase involved in DNA repair